MTEFDWILLNMTEYHWIWTNITEYDLISLNMTKYYYDVRWKNTTDKIWWEQMISEKIRWDIRK